MGNSHRRTQANSQVSFPPSASSRVSCKTSASCRVAITNPFRKSHSMLWLLWLFLQKPLENAKRTKRVWGGHSLSNHSWWDINCLLSEIWLISSSRWDYPSLAVGEAALRLLNLPKLIKLNKQEKIKTKPSLEIFLNPDVCDSNADYPCLSQWE